MEQQVEHMTQMTLVWVQEFPKHAIVDYINTYWRIFQFFKHCSISDKVIAKFKALGTAEVMLEDITESYTGLFRITYVR